MLQILEKMLETITNSKLTRPGRLLDKRAVVLGLDPRQARASESDAKPVRQAYSEFTKKLSFL